MICFSVVIGFFMISSYELLGCIRRALGRGQFLCRADDAVLAVMFAISSYYFMFYTCDGIVRGYNYVFLVCGAVIAYNICSRVGKFRKMKKACGKNYEEIPEQIS